MNKVNSEHGKSGPLGVPHRSQPMYLSILRLLFAWGM
jgi:hypothetical protein